MTNQLETQVASYQRWRDEIRSGIEAYQVWLDQHGHVDIQRSLRIYDLLESMRNDRMVLAFLAEYSRGKTELINAMFFSDFKQRLLPSDVGRTTMCPTEIFHNSAKSRSGRNPTKSYASGLGTLSRNSINRKQHCGYLGK